MRAVVLQPECSCSLRPRVAYPGLLHEPNLLEVVENCPHVYWRIATLKQSSKCTACFFFMPSVSVSFTHGNMGHSCQHTLSFLSRISRLTRPPLGMYSVPFRHLPMILGCGRSHWRQAAFVSQDAGSGLSFDSDGMLPAAPTHPRTKPRGGRHRKGKEGALCRNERGWIAALE